VPDRRIRTIPPFVVKPPDPALRLPEELRGFVEAYKPLLLTVGLLEPEYDLALQVDAIEEVLRRFPGAGLIIAGSGSLERELRRHIASKPYAAHILLYGDMPHAVTLRLMLDADVLLRTTLYDGDSVALREALYLGLPVIATDNGMRPSGVQLIPCSDRERLCDAICATVAGDRPRRAAAGDGQENVRAVVEFYGELLGGSTGLPDR
jgi:glycosyltransferase involved in cell wall biosynthesis